MLNSVNTYSTYTYDFSKFVIRPVIRPYSPTQSHLRFRPGIQLLLRPGHTENAKSAQALSRPRHEGRQ
jgi:hypothetical protein